MTILDQEKLIAAVKRSNRSVEHPGLRAKVYRAVGEWKRERPQREMEEFVFDLVCSIKEQEQE